MIYLALSGPNMLIYVNYFYTFSYIQHRKFSILPLWRKNHFPSSC